MAVGKSLRSRTLPVADMADGSERSGLSPVQRERARLWQQARDLRARGFSEGKPAQKSLDFVPDTEPQFDAGTGSEFQDAQEPFQTDLEQEAGLMSVNQFLAKTNWSDKDIDFKQKLKLKAQSVQKALNELGVDSQVRQPVGSSVIKPILIGACSKGKGLLALSDEEEATTEDETESEPESEDEISEEGDSEENLNLGTTALLGLTPITSAAQAGSSAETQPPRLEPFTDSEPAANSKPDMVDMTAKESDQSTEVYADYKRDNPNTQFKEDSLKEPLRQSLRDLSKAKEQGELPDEGKDPGQDEELLERLMATDSFRAKGVLQERLNVADRVAGGSNKKKRKSPGQPTSPHSPETPRPANSNVSGQTSGGRSVGKVTKSQNLKDSKDGITAMLQVMTSMNDEKKSENQRKVVLNEGKLALTDAKRLESQERATTLIAQRTAIDSTAKMSRISLLKEQKALGIIDDAQFIEACKVVFYS